MDKKKIIIIVATICVVIVSVFFCRNSTKKVESESYEKVEGTIMYVTHRSRNRPQNRIKKSIDLILHPPEYITTIRYDSLDYTLDNEFVYNICVGEQGSTVRIIIRDRKYQNGKHDRDIVNVRGIRIE